MKFVLVILTDSDAFGESSGERAAAVAEMLDKVADKVEKGSGEPDGPRAILDYNGNRVGEWSFEK